MAGLRVSCNNTAGAHRNLFCASAILEASIQRLLGPAVVELMCDAAVQEVSANYDPATNLCCLFADFGAGPMRAIPAIIPTAAIDAATRILATVAGKSLDRDAPFLNCVLASGFRYHAALWPVGDGPSFSIRTHARIVRPLSDFMSDEQAKFVRGAIHARKTILIAGATNTGKTTILNALISLIPVPERLLVIEDEPELQVRAGNVTRRRATTRADLKRHVYEALRDRPDRIIIGEVRGSEAYDMLDAFATGHAGGLSTIHANGCEEALTRLARLANCDQQLINEAIGLVLHVERMPDGRRAVTQIMELR